MEGIVQKGGLPVEVAPLTAENTYNDPNKECAVGGACEFCNSEDTHTNNECHDREECQHFRDICEAFTQYARYALKEVARMERHFHSLSQKEIKLLMEPIDSRIGKMKWAISQNQHLLDLIVTQQIDMTRTVHEPNCPCSHPQTDDRPLTWPIGDGPVETTEGGGVVESPSGLAEVVSDNPPTCLPSCSSSVTCSENNISKVRSTIKQFVRDWSKAGAAERNACYGPILNSLKKYKPLVTQDKDSTQPPPPPPRVLCPGSGLGRLPFEVVRLGYACQGNEFSYFMLLGSNFMLNHMVRVESCVIFPYVLNSSNRKRRNDHLRPVLIPDVCSSDHIEEGADFSMCAGEFVEVYVNQSAQWDAVLTSFFLDTAKNPLLYIHTIANILRPGGLWANIGPLLYHYADSMTEVSVELSWEELRRVIQIYFEIKECEYRDAFYTANAESLMQVLYHCIFFAAIRNDTPVDPDYLRMAPAASALSIS